MLVSELIKILKELHQDVPIHFEYHEGCASPIESASASVFFPEVRLSCRKSRLMVVRRMTAKTHFIGQEELGNYHESSLDLDSIDR